MALLTGSFSHINKLIYHGSPQANSLYSLAALTYMKGWQLDYYVDHVPDFIRQYPTGNYKAALALGARIISTNNAEYDFISPEDYIRDKLEPEHDCLIVPEGGRSELAKEGVTALANELLQWIAENQIVSPVIALPSGTGTTALYLHQVMENHHIPVVTCACVGGSDYLLQQFQSLKAQSYPKILELPKSIILVNFIKRIIKSGCNYIVRPASSSICYTTL